MHLWGCHMPLRNNSQTWISIKPGFWDIMAMEANFLTMKYLTGLWQSLVVPTYTEDVSPPGFATIPSNISGSCCSVGASAPEHMLACWLLGVIELKNLIMGYGKIVKTSRGFGIQVCTPTATRHHSCTL